MTRALLRIVEPCADPSILRDVLAEFLQPSAHLFHVRMARILPQRKLKVALGILAARKVVREPAHEPHPGLRFEIQGLTRLLCAGIAAAQSGVHLYRLLVGEILFSQVGYLEHRSGNVIRARCAADNLLIALSQFAIACEAHPEERAPCVEHQVHQLVLFGNDIRVRAAPGIEIKEIRKLLKGRIVLEKLRLKKICQQELGLGRLR